MPATQLALLQLNQLISHHCIKNRYPQKLKETLKQNAEHIIKEIEEKKLEPGSPAFSMRIEALQEIVTGNAEKNPVMELMAYLDSIKNAANGQ